MQTLTSVVRENKLNNCQFGPTPNYSRALNYKSKWSNDFTVIGGPCSIETPEQAYAIFSQIAEHVTHFRGGVFRAGTYPGDDFGLKMELLKEYHGIARFHNKPNIVDVLDIRDLERIDPYTEVFQVGARQAQHYALLRELGRQKKPVLLKRATNMTLDELLGSVEHILNEGNTPVAIIERGSVSYLNHTRWEPSMSIIARVKQMTGIPILIDASHSTGDRGIVSPMMMAGIAAGADGILIETHHVPEESLSDAQQAVSIPEFKLIVEKACKIREAR